ncbi:MAG: endonuclease domain-containing protein [Devosia sp.]
MAGEGDKHAVPTSPLWGEVDAQRRVRGEKLTAAGVAKARALRRKETDAERRLWNMLRNRGVSGRKFVRQYPISPFIADFVCREEMLVVEVDGSQHIGSVRDDERTACLNARGYSVIRFWNNEITGNPDGVYLALTAVLDGNPSPGWRFSPATLSRRGEGMLRRHPGRNHMAGTMPYLAPPGRGWPAGPGDGQNE